MPHVAPMQHGLQAVFHIASAYADDGHRMHIQRTTDSIVTPTSASAVVIRLQQDLRAFHNPDMLLPTRQQGVEAGAFLRTQGDTIFLVHTTTMPHVAATYTSVLGGLLG